MKSVDVIELLVSSGSTEGTLRVAVKRSVPMSHRRAPAASLRWKQILLTILDQLRAEESDAICPVCNGQGTR